MLETWKSTEVITLDAMQGLRDTTVRKMVQIHSRTSSTNKKCNGTMKLCFIHR